MICPPLYFGSIHIPHLAIARSRTTIKRLHFHRDDRIPAGLVITTPTPHAHSSPLAGLTAGWLGGASVHLSISKSSPKHTGWVGTCLLSNHEMELIHITKKPSSDLISSSTFPTLYLHNLSPIVLFTTSAEPYH